MSRDKVKAKPEPRLSLDNTQLVLFKSTTHSWI